LITRVDCMLVHQHFTSSFCADILLLKKSQNKTVIRAKLRKALSYKKVLRKMLMKISPGQFHQTHGLVATTFQNFPRNVIIGQNGFSHWKQNNTNSKYIQTEPVYNDHPWDPKIVAVVDSWSLFRGHLCNISPICNPKIVVIIDRWSLAQVWLYVYFKPFFNHISNSLIIKAKLPHPIYEWMFLHH